MSISGGFFHFRVHFQTQLPLACLRSQQETVAGQLAGDLVEHGGVKCHRHGFRTLLILFQNTAEIDIFRFCLGGDTHPVSFGIGGDFRSFALRFILDFLLFSQSFVAFGTAFIAGGGDFIERGFGFGRRIDAVQSDTFDGDPASVVIDQPAELPPHHFAERALPGIEDITDPAAGI